MSRDPPLRTRKAPSLKSHVLGWPRWTGLSTNASCQLEKPESSQVKTWGSASTLGVELAPPRCLSSNRRERAARKNLRNVGDTGEGDCRCCCQQNSRPELGQNGSGSPAWIRTTIHGSKGRCPTIRRPGIAATARYLQFILSPAAPQHRFAPALQIPPHSLR